MIGDVMAMIDLQDPESVLRRWVFDQAQENMLDQPELTTPLPLFSTVPPSMENHEDMQEALGKILQRAWTPVQAEQLFAIIREPLQAHGITPEALRMEAWEMRFYPYYFPDMLLKMCAEAGTDVTIFDAHEAEFLSLATIVGFAGVGLWFAVPSPGSAHYQDRHAILIRMSVEILGRIALYLRTLTA